MRKSFFRIIEILFIDIGVEAHLPSLHSLRNWCAS